MNLIAISGGVDSMTLAYLYRNKNVVLAFVNYNLRQDTNIDEKIVDEFAKKHKLKLEKLILNGNESTGNFQDWARNVRYDFFKKIYQKHHCKQLLIAHHKDDFLETCIMQKQKNLNKLFYGIEQKTRFNGMNIYRPLLFRFWKDEIYGFAKKHRINYNDDYTNFQNKYQRNKVRNILLKEKTIEEKQKMLDSFTKINFKNQKTRDQIQNEYIYWKKTKFNTKEFDKLNHPDEVIKEFINKNYSNVNLNSKIIKNIKLFIISKENNKFFKLSNNQFVYKKFYKLFIK